jgi:hypothetical protein
VKTILVPKFQEKAPILQPVLSKQSLPAQDVSQ